VWHLIGMLVLVLVLSRFVVWNSFNKYNSIRGMILSFKGSQLQYSMNGQ